MLRAEARSDDLTPGRQLRSVPDPTWIVIGQFANILFIVLMIRSGPGIFSAFPKFYLADDCPPGKEWLRLTRKVVSAGAGHPWSSFDTEDVWRPGDHLVEPPERRHRPGPGKA